MHIFGLIDRNFKKISLSITFMLVPAFTVFIMTGRCEGFYSAVLCGIAVLFIISFVMSGKKRCISSGLLVMTFFLLAVFIRCVPLYYRQAAYAEKLAETLGNGEHIFSGFTVMEDVYTSEKMFVEVAAVDGQDTEVPFKVYGVNRSGHFINEGAYIEFGAKLRLPQNYDGTAFNTVSWLAGKGIYCEVYDINEVKTDYSLDRLAVGAVLRNGVWNKVLNVLEYIPGRESFERSTALCRALLFGDKSGFSSDELEAFSKSGMTHLLCVSGLHFSVIMGCLSLLCGFVIPDRRRRAVFLAVMSVLYLCMCGFSKSALRAAAMTFISTTGVTYGKRHSCTHTLLLAVSVICIIDPNSVFDTSFRLSVLSCAGIACSAVLNDIVSEKLQFRPILNYVSGTAVMSASCFFFTFSYSACAFGGISTVSVISSVLAVLPSQICMMLAWLSVVPAFIGMKALSFACGNIISCLSDFIYNTAYCLSKFKYSYIQVNVPDLSFAVFMITLCAISFVTVSKAGAAKLYYCVLLSSVLSVIIMMCTAVV